MAKFTLGAALLFEELTGRSISDMANPKITDMVYLIYAQEYWDKENRPSFEQFKKDMSSKDISDISSALNGPFSPKEVQ
jgi:hypothetical protein